MLDVPFFYRMNERKNMNELIEPSFQTRPYTTKEVVFIRDRYQAFLFIKNGARPIDIYTSTDDDLVMVFLKEDTKELYRKYRRFELN